MRHIRDLGGYGIESVLVSEQKKRTLWPGVCIRMGRTKNSMVRDEKRFLGPSLIQQ